MFRRFTPAAVAVSALLLSGCGPYVVPRATTTAGAAPSSDKTPDETAGKPIPRTELTWWLTPRSVGVGRVQWTGMSDVKKRFGPPDDTREVKARGPVAKPDSDPQPYTVYAYKGLTVDTAGTKKVDAETRIFFDAKGNAEPTLTEYTP